MHDCNFADEVCVWVMPTLLWTCPQNCGHMDGLNGGSISCYFMLQKPNLGVCKCILCLCVMFLHTPCMYSSLQPVFSVNLCSVGFANVDVFLIKCVLQKCTWRPQITRYCSYDHKNKCKLKLATSSWYLDQKLWCFKWAWDLDTSHSIKTIFMYSFKMRMRTTVI